MLIIKIKRPTNKNFCHNQFNDIEHQYEKANFRFQTEILLSSIHIPDGAFKY